MKFGILGPLESTPPGGISQLRRAREKSLLAILLMAPNTVHPAEELIRRLWDDEDPSAAAERTLRSYVANVRNVVGVDAAGGATRLRAESGGYLLRIDREAVDLHRFRRLCNQAEAMAQSGDTVQADALLTKAEGLWRGQALAGLPGRWMESMRHSLEEEHRTATFKRVELELELGRHAELTGELQRLSAKYPMDETCVGYQMMALYRSGRQADALRLYREDYQRRAELGLESGPGLAALHQRILRRDPSLDAASAHRRTVRQQPWDDSLPPRPEMVVGRDRELAVLCGVPATGTPTVRIIEGMGGSGKTTLAVEAAYRLREAYPDPPIFLSFRAHEAGQPSLGTAESLRQLLELAGLGAGPSPQTTAALRATWRHELSRRRSVIVLDDVPDAATVMSALPEGGNCLTLITSRPKLTGLSASAVVSLEELPLDDAIGLFTQIAGEPRIDDPDMAARAVRLCGCLPLALTLTASRLRDEGRAVSEFVAEIEERRAFPDRVGMIAPELIQTFELSYAGLGPSHQEFFRRLGLNPCPTFSPRTAAVLVGTTVDAAESALAVLHTRNLIEQSVADRYRFHDLLREYATFVAERDDADWQRRRAERRLLEHYLAAVGQADRLLHPYQRRAGEDPDEVSSTGESEVYSVSAAGRWFELEWRNIVWLVDYAARHEWQRYCVDLGNAVAGFLEERGYWSDGIEVYRAVLRICQDLGDSVGIARASGGLSLFELRTGNYDDALAHANDAAKIFLSAGDEDGAAEAIDRAGTVHRRMGQARVALAYHGEALEIYRKTSNTHGMAEALGHAGSAYYSLGRYAEAITYHENALALYRDTQDRKGMAKSYNNIGDALCEQGRYRDAMPNLEKALGILQEVNAFQGFPAVRLNMGRVAQSKGRYHDAITAYRAALEACHETGDLRHLAAALHDIGTVYQERGHHDQALLHHQKAEAIAKEIGDLSTQVLAGLGIADALCGSGAYARALERYHVVLELALQTEDVLRKGRALEGMAEAERRMGDVTAARVRLREAQDVFQASGIPDASRVAWRLATLDGSDVPVGDGRP
ncbi:MAG: tetratricopeptide repeat protein [Nocardiopsaceae bacterium]|nr:tetratricopeptide repeat protein [Nocardiopsaceae bacterium]